MSGGNAVRDKSGSEVRLIRKLRKNTRIRGSDASNFGDVPINLPYQSSHRICISKLSTYFLRTNVAAQKRPRDLNRKPESLKTQSEENHGIPKYSLQST